MMPRLSTDQCMQKCTLFLITSRGASTTVNRSYSTPASVAHVVCPYSTVSCVWGAELSRVMRHYFYLSRVSLICTRGTLILRFDFSSYDFDFDFDSKNLSTARSIRD